MIYEWMKLAIVLSVCILLIIWSTHKKREFEMYKKVYENLLEEQQKLLDEIASHESRQKEKESEKAE